ncbi:MAG: Maf family protein [Pseudomonadota bacterium]
MTLYLASKSPRRAELLGQIGVDFTVHDIDIDESRLAGETAVDYVCRITRNKADQAISDLMPVKPSDLVLAADTTIALDGDIIGKPEDREHCRSILNQLSSRQHQVLTAVAIASINGTELCLTTNQVFFRAISEREIENYCSCREPMDKAGAYAIQGKAAVFIEKLEGSYSSVMGLPLFETANLLSKVGIDLFEP